MKVFLDKEFVRNFWNIPQDSMNVMNHFQKEFLKNTNSCTIVTNYLSLEDILQNEEDFFFLEELFEGVPKLEFNPKLTNVEEIKELSSANDFKIFFLEQSEAVCAQLENLLGYEFISSDTLMKKWGKHYETKSLVKTTSLTPDENDPDTLSSWNDLKFLSEFPNNSIVVIDKYILSDNSNNRLKDNLFPLLKTLLPDKLETPLFLTIISGDILTSNKGASVIERTKKVYGLIHSYLAQFKNLKVDLTIVNNDNSFYPRGLELHDRVIYTNYYYLMSSKGWDIFNKKERKLGNSRINIDFNFQRFQMKELKGHFHILAEYLKKMNRMEVMSSVFKHYPETIKNPLLN